MFDRARASRSPAIGAHGMGSHVTGDRSVSKIVKSCPVWSAYAPCRDDAHFLSSGNEAFAEMTITGLRFLNHGKVENGHLSASLDFVTSAPRQSALSRERQRLSVSTLTLWPTFETG